METDFGRRKLNKVWAQLHQDGHKTADLHGIVFDLVQGLLYMADDLLALRKRVSQLEGSTD